VSGRRASARRGGMGACPSQRAAAQRWLNAGAQCTAGARTVMNAELAVGQLRRRCHAEGQRGQARRAHRHRFDGRTRRLPHRTGSGRCAAGSRALVCGVSRAAAACGARPVGFGTRDWAHPGWKWSALDELALEGSRVPMVTALGMRRCGVGRLGAGVWALDRSPYTCRAWCSAQEGRRPQVQLRGRGLGRGLSPEWVGLGPRQARPLRWTP